MFSIHVDQLRCTIGCVVVASSYMLFSCLVPLQFQTVYLSDVPLIHDGHCSGLASVKQQLMVPVIDH